MGFARGGGVVGIRVQVRCGGLVVVVRKKFGGLGPSVLRVWCCGCDCHALIVAVLASVALRQRRSMCNWTASRSLSARFSLSVGPVSDLPISHVYASYILGAKTPSTRGLSRLTCFITT